MITEVKIQIDIEDLFNNLSSAEKAKFCDIVLDWMDDAEIFEALDKRSPNWSDFGLQKE